MELGVCMGQVTSGDKVEFDMEGRVCVWWGVGCDLVDVSKMETSRGVYGSDTDVVSLQ